MTFFLASQNFVLYGGEIELKIYTFEINFYQ